MKLTLKKLIWATVISLIFTALKLIEDDPWISPADVKFWANDIAIVIAWILFFLEKKKK